MAIFIFLYLHVKLSGLYSIVDILEPCRNRRHFLKTSNCFYLVIYRLHTKELYLAPRELGLCKCILHR